MSRMIYQLRFVLRSHSQDTHEANKELLQRHGMQTAKSQILKRLGRFIKGQEASTDDTLTHLFLPRARQLEMTLQLSVSFCSFHAAVPQCTHLKCLASANQHSQLF